MNVLSATKDHFYSVDHKFTYQNGLNLAFAFTEFNSGTEWELPQEYGSIEVMA